MRPPSAQLARHDSSLLPGPLTVGTAGHIDHGKTRLVEALTGIDTDRLPAERERGISIELGYARLVLPSGRPLSVVDVPGHERFVRTMVAGATGIDLFLLVIDAREGPRPQTYEHLGILRLLGLEHGLVAVTKSDVAECAQIDDVADFARELVPGSEVVPVSSRTGEGLEQLIAALDRLATAVERPAHLHPARLYVDRVFSLPGAGTIVTGTLWSGTVAVGDTLELLPGALEIRVRSVQVHGEGVERAEAGQRVALGISADRKGRLERGAVLVEPATLRASFRLDVALDEIEPVKNGARVQVCHGTSAVPARVMRIGEGYAQLRLARPLVAARGDRVVLRQESTIGGGRVLDPQPRRHADAARIEQVDVDDPRVLLSNLVDAPVRIDSLRRSGMFVRAELDRELPGLVRAGKWVFSPAWLERTRVASVETLARRGSEIDPGLPAQTLLGDAEWSASVAPLLELQAIEGKLYLQTQRPSTEARGGEAASLEKQLAESGLAAMRIPSSELARQLEREGRLVRLGNGLAIGAPAYEWARAVVVAECEQAGTISLSRFRDLAGTSRRVAQLLLERCDSDRLTLRVGDARRLRRAVSGIDKLGR